MNCPDCKTKMTIDFIDLPADKSYFEVVFKCLKCKATFFGTIYRDLDQASNDAICVECEEKKNAL